MDFVFYNLSDNLKPQHEVHTLMPLIALSEEKAIHASHVTTAGEMIDNKLFTENPRHIANLFASTLTATNGTEALANQMKDIILQTDKLKKKKFKTKTEMMLIARGNKITDDARKFVQRTLHSVSISYEMHRTNTFLKSKHLAVRYVSHNKSIQTDDERLISAFQDVVSESEFGAMMVCGGNMMQHLNAIELTGEQGDNIENSYARLKLFELPGFLSLKKSKYYLMREEMKPELEAWWKGLYDTTVYLSGMDYSNENFSAVQQVIKEKVGPVSEALRKKLDESIYIKQLSNDEYGEYGSTMYFALTSRLELLKAYHQTRQLPDEALAKLKEHFGSRNLNGRICCFLHHVVPNYPPPGIPNPGTTPEELEKLWHDSFND